MILNSSKQLISQLGERDVLIVLGGTNDTHPSNPSYQVNLDKISKIAEHTRVIVAYVPAKFDSWEGPTYVHRLNRLVITTSVTKYQPPMDTNYYGFDQLHFNYMGKSKIARDLAKIIRGLDRKGSQESPVRWKDMRRPNYIKKPHVQRHPDKIFNIDPRPDEDDLQDLLGYLAAVSSLRYDVSKRLYTDVIMGGLLTTALLDTGATHVFIKSEFFYPLQKKGIVIRPFNSEAVMGNGTLGYISGIAKIPLNIGNKVWVGECYLIKDLPYDLILGVNVLREMRAVFNFAANKVSFQDSAGREDIPIFELAACEMLGTDVEQPEPESFLLEPTTPSVLETLSADHATPEQLIGCKRLLAHWIDRFKSSPGCTDIVTHSIELIDSAKTPIKVGYRTYSPATEAIIQEELKKLLEKDIIEESESPYSFPLLLVPKKDGKRRVVSDFRLLNNITVKRSFPLPRIDDLLDRLKDSRWCSSLDLLSGFFQIALDEASRPLTAFSVNHRSTRRRLWVSVIHRSRSRRV